jgi:hypothetical protein
VHRETRNETATRCVGSGSRQPPLREHLSAFTSRPFVQWHVQRFRLGSAVQATLARFRFLRRHRALLLGKLLDFVEELLHLQGGTRGSRGRVRRAQVGQTADVGARHAVGHAVLQLLKVVIRLDRGSQVHDAARNTH